MCKRRTMGSEPLQPGLDVSFEFNDVKRSVYQRGGKRYTMLRNHTSIKHSLPQPQTHSRTYPYPVAQALSHQAPNTSCASQISLQKERISNDGRRRRFAPLTRWYPDTFGHSLRVGLRVLSHPFIAPVIDAALARAESEPARTDGIPPRM